MMIYNLNLDDCIPAFTRFDLLDRIIAEFPKVKITLFVTLDSDVVTENCDLRANPDWIRRLLRYWPTNIELAYHGYHHSLPDRHGEFWNLTREHANALLARCEAMAAGLGLPMTKGFRAPKWELSEGTRRALEDRRYLYLADAPGYYEENKDIRIPRLFPNHDTWLGAIYEDTNYRAIVPDLGRYCIERGHCICQHPNTLSPKTVERMIETLHRLRPTRFAFLSELVGEL